MAGDATRFYLQSQGYQVRFRIAEWVECLIAGEGEAWIGRHLEREGAFEAALALMCPAPLTRRLLEEAVARSQSTPALLEVLDSALPEQARAHDAPRLHDAVRLEPPKLVAVAVSARVTAPPTTHVHELMLPDADARAIEPTPLSSASVSITRAPRSALPVGNATPSIEPPYMPDPRVVGDPEKSVEALDVLTDRIRDSREELGLCAPERQRLAMLAWICEARSHADAFPEDLRIRDRVGAISRQLTDVGKTFWPGSVTALQLHMQPRDLPRHLLGGTASTWYRAAELAEAALRAKEQEDERRAFDTYGWADHKQLYPRPSDPEKVLEEVVGEVERLSGRLSTHAAPSDQNARPDALQFLRWVRMLRWLRGTDVDPERWARLAGRLRWWAFRREPALGGPSRELEASFAPGQSWASLLGLDPEVRRLQVRVIELLSTAPTFQEPGELVRWLLEALPFGDTYHANIVRLMEPHRELVLALTPETLPDADRRLRRRLTRLQEDLQSPSLSLRMMPLPADAREVTIHAELLADLAPTRPTERLPERLVARVRVATEGKRAVLISHRRDPEVQAALEETFGFASLELKIADPRRAQALTEAIEEGQFDMVLSATGFQLQSLDHLLAGACKSAKVPYLRVNRGHVLACLRALARDLDGRV
jgi:HPt (histidine-containing phosphotransfer) domain-containing protein